MTFLWHQVAPPLRAYINFLYAPCGSMPYWRDGIFPTPSTDLKFNFGEPWIVHDRLDSSVASVCTESWCLGIWNQRHFVEWPARTDFVGVSFKPGGSYAFLGVPVSELHSRVVPLDAIWGSDAAEIRERLYDAATPQRRFALFERLLLARLQDRSDPARIVRYAAGQIVQWHGAVRIGELCHEVGVSHKHLITLFNRVVGCAPKELARLCRFEHALASIDVSRPVRWTSLAHEGDYFDQSHFSRDFEAYAGLTPASYLEKRRLVHAEAPDHASVPWVLPAG
ncbi:MAG: helix-turn-helix domain-containing protein [Devosia sp.]